MGHKILEITVGTLAAFTILIVLVISLGWLAHVAPRDVISKEVQRGLKNGEIQVPGRWDLTDIRGIDTFTDCMVLQIATDAPKNFKEDLLDSLIYQEPLTKSVKYQHACNTLAARDFRLNDGYGTETRSYGRYWWGSATLARIALGWGRLSVNAYRTLVFVCVIASLSAYTFILARRVPKTILLLTPYIFAYFCGFNLLSMGQSISQAPEEVIGVSIVAYLLLSHASEKPLLARAALYGLLGMICIYLDLLNGVVILLLSLVLMGSCAEFYEIPIESPTPFRTAAFAATKPLSAIAFIALGAIISLMIRIEGQALVNHVTFLTQGGIWHASLANRVDGTLSDIGKSDTRPTVKVAIDSLVGARKMPFHGILPKHVADLFYLAGFAGWLTGFWFACRNLRSNIDTQKIVKSVGVSIMALLCGSLTPAWYLVFLQHTIVHSWMTARLLAIFCGTGQ